MPFNYPLEDAVGMHLVIFFLKQFPVQKWNFRTNNFDIKSRLPPEIINSPWFMAPVPVRNKSRTLSYNLGRSGASVARHLLLRRAKGGHVLRSISLIRGLMKLHRKREELFSYVEPVLSIRSVPSVVARISVHTSIHRSVYSNKKLDLLKSNPAWNPTHAGWVLRNHPLWRSFSTRLFTLKRFSILTGLRLPIVYLIRSTIVPISVPDVRCVRKCNGYWVLLVFRG